MRAKYPFTEKFKQKYKDKDWNDPDVQVSLLNELDNAFTEGIHTSFELDQFKYSDKIIEFIKWLYMQDSFKEWKYPQHDIYDTDCNSVGYQQAYNEIMDEIERLRLKEIIRK